MDERQPTLWLSHFIKEVDQSPFTRATRLGRGENCAVYSLHPSTCDYDSVSELSDESDEESCASSHSHRDDDEGEEDEDEEPYFSDDGDCEMDDPERVTKQSPFGNTQVIAKVFRRLDEEVTFIIKNVETGRIERFLPSADDAEYIMDRCFKKKRVEIQEITNLVTDTSIGFQEFPLESLIHLFLSKLDTSPHILHCFESLQFQNTGYLLLERISTTFEELVNIPELEQECLGEGKELTSDHIGIILFQTLAVLDMLQRVCQFKHHDLHIGNVFIKKIDAESTFREQKLQEATHFHYKIDDINYYIPNIGIIPKISDFAMSSLSIHGKRLGRADISTFNDDEAVWGRWSNDYEGERGYDAQVLFGDVPFDKKSKHKTCQRLRGLMKKLRSTAFSKQGKVSKKKGRPLPGHVSNKPAEMIIRGVYGTSPDAWYNYLTPPESGSVVITLGNTDWL